MKQEVRTVIVQSPSVLRETAGVVRAVVHIVFWSALLMGASWFHGRSAGTAARTATAVDEVAFAALDGDAQRLYRDCLTGLAEAETTRSTTGDWPTVEQLAARKTPPFADAGYRWRMLRDGTLVNYVGEAANRPAFVISILEPDPGMPIDPQAVVDETHHKLRDGTVLHVSVWTGTKTLTKPAASPPFEDGWRRITMTTSEQPIAPASGPLRVGVTLHPYYSWTANVIAGVAGAEVVPVLPGEIDAGNYQPSPDDIATIAKLDAIVINGIGHDDFIADMIKASGNTRLVVIQANAETALMPSAHGEAQNSHTFISFTNAIQQTELIARKLGALRPADAAVFARNAAAYAGKLRAIRDAAAARLANAKIKRVVTVHDGYTYLLKEFGIDLVGVVQPAHGLTPSAKELGDMIELMKREHVSIVLTEEDFPDKLLQTLREATGAKVYIISHVAIGAYSPAEFETVMTKNADTLIQALVTDPP